MSTWVCEVLSSRLFVIFFKTAFSMLTISQQKLACTKISGRVLFGQKLYGTYPSPDREKNERRRGPWELQSKVENMLVLDSSIER
jgi:hypothetical protein